MSDHIASIDKTISILRERWLMATKLDEKKLWLSRIDAALDTRITLMKLRDGIANGVPE